MVSNKLLNKTVCVVGLGYVGDAALAIVLTVKREKKRVSGFGHGSV